MLEIVLWIAVIGASVYVENQVNKDLGEVQYDPDAETEEEFENE